MKPTSKIIQILPNNKHGDEHRSTPFFRYSFIALCEDGSLWAYKEEEWERIYRGDSLPVKRNVFDQVAIKRQLQCVTRY